MPLLAEDVVKILLAVVIGGAIGFEREFRDKTAGFRTLIFICVGACLFTLFSLKIGVNNDPGRIAANIVSGVGFLGAGAILRDGSRVTGLTTASMIWLVAALGMGIGAGHLLLSLFGVGVVSVVLWIFPRFEDRVDQMRDSRTYQVTSPCKASKMDEIEKLFQESSLNVHARQRVKAGENFISTWQVSGPPRLHEPLVEKLIARDDVTEVSC